MAKGTKILNHGLKCDEDGNVYIKVSDETPVAAQLVAGQAIIYLDQAGDRLGFKVKYEDGTFKTGAIDLA